MQTTDLNLQDEQKELLLSVRDLTVSFSVDDGTFTAADSISFDVKTGETVGLVGESGCGKSVTALSIPRLIPSPPGTIESGEIWFEGQDLMTLNSSALRDIRGRDISMIFQEPLSALSPLHRIGQQMIETILLHQDKPRKQAWEIAEGWLKKVGIPDAGDRMFAYPFQLSGGMQQRIMIAMALMLSPRLIIADEPTTALDVTTQAQIFALIRDMKQHQTSMLLITHDMGVVWEMCDRILVMYASRIVETGSREDVFFNPRHPYTIGLLQAIPKLTGLREPLKDIPGQVPSPFDYPKGCHFQARCVFAMDRCRESSPPAYDCGQGHRAACFLMEGRPA
ncbi:MAG: ABC transporter ATP-binding protein [Desulfobacteraceae bacterium]|nr:MAG: ABC transporter ATP-binding protein [Desulfobacteraceae bacterium]